MDATHHVVAFCDSPALRETLSVLLEHECELRFLAPDDVVVNNTICADLAVVAMHRPTDVLHDLTRRWPSLPIIAVAGAAPRAATEPGVASVPLDPRAIRTAVLQRLPDERHTFLRASAGLVAETLHTELHYSFTALRSFSALDAGSTAADTFAVFAAIMREQSYVIGEAGDQLYRFQRRPRAVETAPQFAAALCRALEQSDCLVAERGLLCECTVDRTALTAAGPVTLAPEIAAFLRFHLRRRSDSPIAKAKATARGVVLTYTPRTLADPPTASWPLLLAALALRPWSWHVLSTTDGPEERVVVCPL
ncbi:MAG: hypothetical protein ACHQ9S_16945 [Candidatus Binatia bacterium]